MTPVAPLRRIASERILSGGVLLALAAAVILMAVRLSSVFSLDRPLLVITSGAEEEAAMSLWRGAFGEAYPDPFDIPFSASYYNWLFVKGYGTAIKTIMAALELDGDYFSPIGKSITLAGTVLGAGLLIAAMRVLAPEKRNRAFVLGVGLYVFAGPLVGWWAVSLHPEIWATACTLAAALAIMKLYDRVPLAAIGLASAASLAAWSFKQSYLFAALALGLFLLSRKDWRGLVLVAIVHGAGIGLILGLGGELYRKSLVLAGTGDFEMQSIRYNFINWAAKAGAIVLAAGLALSAKSRLAALWRDTAGRFALLAALVSLAAIPATAKYGAGENYYFPLTAFLALIAVRIQDVPSQSPWINFGILSLAAAWAGHAALIAATLLGVYGRTSVAANDAKFRAQRECVRELPSPMWASDEYLSLPWMHPSPPHFVPAYNYSAYRKRGMPMTADGIGGMVSSAAFASLVLRNGSSTTEIDGARIPDSYRLVRANCAGLDIYLLADTAK